MMPQKEKKSEELHHIYEEIQRDPKYRNDNMGHTFVPGNGSLQDNGLVFIGEAPGEEEENKRLPFVGPAGRNLNALLSGVGISREQVFITNLVKYRPVTPRGENRSPTMREARNALPYLIRELNVLSPRIVVCLGLSSAKALLDRLDIKMGEANGNIFEKYDFSIFVTYHPSPYNYRIPEKREAMQIAFKRLREIYAE